MPSLRTSLITGIWIVVFILVMGISFATTKNIIPAILVIFVLFFGYISVSTLMENKNDRSTELDEVHKRPCGNDSCTDCNSDSFQI